MIIEKKWAKRYGNSNEYGLYLCKVIGSLLQTLRRENNGRLEYVSRQTDVDYRILEANELGRQKFHWFAAFRVLKYYGKALEIKLVDATYEEETPEKISEN